MIRRALFLLIWALPAAAQACPGCNTGVDSGKGAATTTHLLAGFSWSVLLLVGAALGAISILASLAMQAAKQDPPSIPDK